MSPPAPLTLQFDSAALNLQPQQPSRVRRGWERVPTKAVGISRSKKWTTNAPIEQPNGPTATAIAQQQRKERTVWKRPGAKPFTYATENGGTGFAVEGSKRRRMKNLPDAYPVQSGRGPAREAEAEATDDELFSRRRKSARRSSINPNRRVLSPTKSSKDRLISAPRPARSSTLNPQRSPLKNLRVMELTQSPQKQSRPSLGAVLGNGTPMRNAFAESAWAARSPGQPVGSPAKETSPSKGLSPQKELSPAKELSLQKRFSPQKAPSPQKGLSPTRLFLPPKKSTPQKVFSPSNTLSQQLRFSFHISPSRVGATTAPPPAADDATMGSIQVTSASSPQKQPRRRSARLSAHGAEQAVGDQPDATVATIDPQPHSEGTPVESSTTPIYQSTDSTASPGPFVASPLIPLRPDETQESEAQERPNESASQQLAMELALASPAVIKLEEDVKETVESESVTSMSDDNEMKIEGAPPAEHTEDALNSQSPESILSPGPEIEMADQQEDEIAITVEAPSQQEQESPDENEELEEQSEDELTTRLDHWTDPARLSQETESTRSRNAPRLSDDTTILKDFLSRAQAKRAAAALAAPSGSPVKTSAVGASPVKGSPSKTSARSRSSPFQISPRRSPRRALACVDGNSPSPTKPDLRPTTGRAGGTPPSKATGLLSFDADESDELASPAKSNVSRRSTRAKPMARPAGSGPSLIPLRRPDGAEPPPRLRKTPAQELAIVTRSNTRRNGGDRPVHTVLQDLAARELSPVKPRMSADHVKAVDWNAELVEYLGEAKKAAKDRASKKAKVKRTIGLGASNGTPAKARTALRADGGPASAAGAVSAGKANLTPARVRPRRAQA